MIFAVEYRGNLQWLAFNYLICLDIGKDRKSNNGLATLTNKCADVAIVETNQY